MNNKTDVIVVGGGPAGIAAAITVAKSGKSVILIERGNFSGSKNVFGGAIYIKPTTDIFPDFEKSAPLERKTVNHKYVMLTESDSVAVSYKSQNADADGSYSVIRAKFDKWMARQAEDAGVVLVTETLAKDLIMKENKVTGVKTELEDYYSDIVILADGVNSLLARKIGLRKELKPKDVALGVKEVIKLKKEVIESRFNLKDGEGAIYELFGEPMAGLVGLGYLYTNRESVSIGLGISLEEVTKHQLRL